MVDKLDGVCAAVVRQKILFPLQAYSSLSLSNELRRPAAYGSMLNESDRKCNKKGDKVAVRSGNSVTGDGGGGGVWRLRDDGLGVRDRAAGPSAAAETRPHRNNRHRRSLTHHHFPGRKRVGD